ncbi:hypothetical protein HanPI659440_Chr04g0147311 [Helianthus annuus]|nr:hypothetical protein HanPI659440_Chr04g0147311 [Helianthus annuus]
MFQFHCHRAWLRLPVTQVWVSKCVGHLLGPVQFGLVCKIWLARSNLRVGSCALSEGFGYLYLRLRGIALGCLHRAAQ